MDDEWERWTFLLWVWTSLQVRTRRCWCGVWSWILSWDLSDDVGCLAFITIQTLQWSNFTLVPRAYILKRTSRCCVMCVSSRIRPRPSTWCTREDDHVLRDKLNWKLSFLFFFQFLRTQFLKFYFFLSYLNKNTFIDFL